MVIQLMRYGADPSLADGEGYRSLHLAVLFQHMPIAAYLMAKGQVWHTHSDILNDDKGFKYWVMQLNTCVPVLLQEVDTPDINGQTPLMLGAQKIIG